MVAAHRDFDADAARLRYAEQETDGLVRIAYVDSGLSMANCNSAKLGGRGAVL